ncbi:hypothetical protein B0H11DRAFT_1956801 [Mycena galericulata]|nr:hypothetical protein B0H11DRAFT_1956801 [Mycena galericulata]
MRSPFFVAAALAARAIAQVPLQINTPGGANTANECQPCLITWSGGTPPYFINVQDSVGNDIVNSFNSVSGTSVTWTVDASAGTSLMFTIRDNNGDTTSSAPFTVGPGSGDSCLPSNPPPSGTGGSSVTSVAPATSPSNSPPATSPSQTSGPPPTGASNTASNTVSPPSSLPPSSTPGTSTPGSGSAPNSQTGKCSCNASQ